MIRSFLRTSEQLAREHGLTPRRLLLLLMIKGAPDGSEQSTVTELAERLQLAQSTVTELVGRAERVGLIERERSERDLRVAHLRLTAEGESGSRCPCSGSSRSAMSCAAASTSSTVDQLAKQDSGSGILPLDPRLRRGTSRRRRLRRRTSFVCRS